MLYFHLILLRVLIFLTLPLNFINEKKMKGLKAYDLVMLS